MSVGGFGTWAAMSPPTTNTTTTAFTGGPWTFTRTAVASSAETIVTFKISDDSTSNVIIKNASASDSLFVPHLQMQVAGSSNNTLQSFEVQTDSGSTAAHAWRAQTIAGAAVTSRPPFEWRNWTNTVLQMLPLNSGANSCLSWGTQAGGVPAFTTRSNGTRLVLYNSLSGSAVDYAICVDPSNNFSYQTIPQASLTYSHIIYGGTSPAWRVYGDGRMQTYGGRVVKLRVATTTPITVAVTDHVVISQLGTPGAVAVNLPATPATGLEFVIKDGTGDAAANNITITPAAGNIDGAGTLVLAANYAVAKLVYNGTQWNRIGS